MSVLGERKNIIVALDVCFECNHSAAGEVQLHHVVPRSLGGSRVIPLCSICHGKVHGKERTNQINMSELTKVGLAAAKARGAVVGNPRWRIALEKAAVARREACKPLWREQLEEVRKVKATGVVTFSGIARCLNARGVRTSRGCAWTTTAVIRLLNKKGRV